MGWVLPSMKLLIDFNFSIRKRALLQDFYNRFRVFRASVVNILSACAMGG
jgi:hypothetical protein